MTAAPDADQPRWLSEQEQLSWAGVARLVAVLPVALDAQLQQDAGLSYFEYLTLARLSMAPDHTLRMSGLAEEAGGSLSRLSNVVKRLEQRGFVRREPDPANRRFINALLTEQGWAKVKQAAPGHVEAVRTLVLDPLSVDELTQLGALCNRLVEHAQGSCPPADPTGC
jgi:DNA-binding MarR family transcriptional regulator